MDKKVYIKELKKLCHDEDYVCCVVQANKLLENYPEDNTALRILGNCLASLERFNDAIQIGEKAILVAKDDEKYISLVTMAFTLYQQGSYKEALNFYKKAFDNPESRLVDKVNCAESLIKLGKYTDAIELLTDPTINQKPVQMYVLGVAYRAAEKYSDALECFQKTLQMSRDKNDDYELADISAKDIIKMMRMNIKIVKK